MRVAFATQDCEHVDELRLTSHLVVFEVTGGGAEVHRVFAFPSGRRTGTEARIRTILDADLVVVAAIGPSLAVRLASQGVRPVTAPGGARIRDVVAALAREVAELERPVRRAARAAADRAVS